jgi:predicted nucleic acid-binding protein
VLLLDTSIWINLIKGRTTPGVAFAMARQDSDDLALTELIYQEVLQGAATDKLFEKLIGNLTQQVLLRPAHDLATFETAALLYRRARIRGYTIRSTIDCLIAAIAIEHNATLVHHDRDYIHLALIEPMLSIFPRALN